MTSVWAHRGASGHAPENTLESFELARRIGAEGVELDVRCTRDGHIVVHHDDTVNRTSNGKGMLERLSLAKARRFNYGNGLRGYSRGVEIPTIEDVLHLLAPSEMMINIELKVGVPQHPDVETRLDAIVQSFGMSERVIYSAFNHYRLDALRSVGAKSPTGVLFSEALHRPWEYAAALGARAIHPPYRLLLEFPEWVERAHDAGLAVNTWTVDSPEDMAAMFDLGVDAVITNFPALGLEVRGTHPGPTH